MDRPFRLHPPPAAPRSFVRPRIHQRLARRFDHRVITLVAGAGFGKTTALAHAIAENAIDPRGLDVWLGCEPADTSASTLLRAIERRLAGDERPRTSETTVDDVCAAVWALAPMHVCLVLDDAHAIEPGSPGQGALVALAESLPANGHLVVASRRRVAIPVARLLGHARADEIDEDDLRLDDAEVATLAGLHRVPTTEMSDVSGWPALVELLASAGGDAAARFVGEEVLSGLGERRRRALSLLSAIGGADATVASEVCGHPVTPDDFADVPLVAHDRSGAIRPHALWEHLVQGELSDDEIADARLVAANTLQARGRHAEAFELLVAVGQWHAALPVLFDACTDQTDPPWADVMDRWCSMLPAELADEPEVQYARGMIARGTDPWLASTALIEDASRALGRRGDRARAAAASVRASFTSIVRNDPTWCARGTEPMRERSARGEPLLPFEAITLATVDLIEGRHRDCLRHAAACGEPEPRLRHFPGYYSGVSLLGLGDPHAALTPAIAGAQAARAIAPAAGSCLAMTLPDAARLAGGRLRDVDVDTLVDPGRRFSIAERVPLMALGVIARANVGRIADARALLAEVDAVLAPAASRPLADGWRAVAAAATAFAAGDESAATNALDLVASGEFRAGGAGQAVLWFPAHPYVAHAALRDHLDATEHAPHRQQVITACRAVISLRGGGPVAPGAFDVLDDIDAAVATLGLRLVIEIVVRGARRDQAAITRALAERWPEPVRTILREHAAGSDEVARRSAQQLASEIPIPPSHRVSLRFCGVAALAHDGVETAHPNWRRGRVRQLLACIALHRRLRREQLADLLWPDADQAGASANLRMTLSYAQALLEPERRRGDAPWFLQQDAGSLALRACPELDVDVWSIDEQLDRATAHRADGRPTLELACLEDALGRWHGDAFEDLAEFDWAVGPRQRFQARCVDASDRAAALLEAVGRSEDATSIAERGLAADPWNEALHLLVIRTRVAAGDRAGAIAALDRCRRAMGEVGAEVPEIAVQQVASI